MSRVVSPLLLAAALLLAALFPAAAAPPNEGTSEAVAWLRDAIRADGGFSDGFSDESSLSATTEALFAALATQQDPATWGSDTTPLDYLAAQAPTVTKTGDLAKLILLAQATGQAPTDFGGVDLVNKLEAQYDSQSGLFAGTVPEHAYAMLALKAAGKPIPDAATTALVALQGADGGWAFDGTSQADTNTTGLVLQALAAAGQGADAPAVSKALTFLKGQQNTDGGFPYQKPSDYGTESDANSTAWAIQGLIAQEQSLAEWNTPETFLATLQAEDGSFAWKAEVPGANFLATAQAVTALEGVTLLSLPSMTAAQAPTPAATPDTLPATGTVPTRWAQLLMAGIVLLLGGLGLRRWGYR